MVQNSNSKKSRPVPASPVDLRQAIRQRLDQMGKPVTWLAERQSVCHPQTVRAYLYGSKATTSDWIVQNLLPEVGLKVVEDPEFETADG